jgi:Domain of unknown function (DUF4062)/Tetratricopeptide repeat
MAKVYVSSTMADLERERRAVLDWLRLARLQAVDSYLPNSETVRDSVLDDVAGSDLYVLIVGHRYGFVPTDGNPEGLSITQLEFRRAGECGIPRVVLVRMSIPDVSLSDIADLEKLALVLGFRDEVAGAVRAAEFRNESGLIQGLSTGFLGELDKLAKRPAGEMAAGRVQRLAPRPVFFAGREELLAKLHTRLASDNGAGPRVAALTGLSGAGKTCMALEYAHLHLGEVGLAWQFPAEDPAVLAAGFGELATQLGGRDLPGGRDPVTWVHGALATYSASWLLMFDNAPSRAAVEPFLPPAGHGRVLITSRDPFWLPGEALEVPLLEPQIAAAFLATRTGDPDQQAALDLAGELGELPLVLEQAAAHIQASDESLAGYLASSRQQRTEMLARGEPAGYSEPVATTWALAFSELEQSAPQSAGLLRLLAHCAAEAIPLPLLLQPRPGLAGQFAPQVAPLLVPLLEDQGAADDAIAVLRQYSLIIPAEGGSVSVHRLVQAVTADQMPAELAEVWRQATASVIEAAIPDNPRQPDTWPDFAALLPHAQVALTMDSTGMSRIASYLGYSGSYAAAHELYQRVLAARVAVLGAEDPHTLTTRGNLAWWTGEAGDAAGARDEFAALLPVRERISGAENPETLVDRANLARWTGEAGDAAGARDQFAALLPVQERVSGPEHSDTLNARANLAYWTLRAGDMAGARDQFAALLRVRERVSGPEDPETLADRANLAYYTGYAGDAAGARDQYTALLPVQERVSGPKHPDTLNVRANLARWTGDAGDAVGARDQYAALLPVRERVLGPEHPDTLKVRANLARWTGEAGDAIGARDRFAALLPVRERVSGPEHPDTLTARSNLASWTGRAGDAAGARDQLNALLPVRVRVLGPEHPDTLLTRNNLAYWAGEVGDAAGARDQFAALLPVRIRVLGPEHPDALKTRANLARWTGEAGDPAGARDQFAALLTIRQRVLGLEHRLTQKTRENLAYWTTEADRGCGPGAN